MKAPVRRGQDTGTRWEPPDREWLEHQYTTLEKSAIEISYELGASIGGNTVLTWLRRLGISVRTRSQAERLTKIGSKNPSWKGGHSRGTGKRALLRRGDPEICALCGSVTNIDTHHLDGDATNNALENLEFRCHKCHMKGHREGSGVLTEAEVLEIRELSAEGAWTQQELSDEYGVARSTISNIVTGYTWE